MVFNSLQFFIFFPVVTILYFLIPHRLRAYLLLTASVVFYMAFIPKYVLILAFTIVIDYFAGILIARSEGPHRKGLLALSIAANVGVLAFFKYFNFLNSNVAAVADALKLHYPVPALAIILPIGLSFHTFQAMSYTIEVYRGNYKAETNFITYALYVMFYPQLVAGPIERPQNLLHQFREEHTFDYQRVADGLKLMAWGLFKKVVIADRLAMFVNLVYDAPRDYEGLTLIAATVAFAFQIFCDFSGYSDIAIGSAQVMGFKLMTNFRRPYWSQSIHEFWSRWHISLSTWFKDYFYIPLGGNKVGWARWQINLLLTFIVSGLWHGANWTFITWGALNGFYLVFALWTRGYRARFAEAVGFNRRPIIAKGVRIALTFFLICVSWVFFRAANMSDALYILAHSADGLSQAFSRGKLLELVSLIRLACGGSLVNVLAPAVAIIIMEILHNIQEQGISIRQTVSSRPPIVRWSLYYGLVMATVLFGSYIPSQFIYFQF